MEIHKTVAYEMGSGDRIIYCTHPKRNCISMMNAGFNAEGDWSVRLLPEHIDDLERVVEALKGIRDRAEKKDVAHAASDAR